LITGYEFINNEEDAPHREPMSVKDSSRKSLSTDEKKIKDRLKKSAVVLSTPHQSSYSAPGYYVVTKDGSCQAGPYATYSLAIANLQGRDAIQYMDQGSVAPLNEAWPFGSNTVNGSLSTDAAFPTRQDNLDAFNADPDSSHHMMVNYENHAPGSTTQSRKLNVMCPCGALRAHNVDPDDAQGVFDEHVRTHGINAYAKYKGAELSFQIREARLLQAMALATPAEQRMLMGDLEEMRQDERMRHQASREVDLARSYVNDVLTPVETYVPHTAATDWLDDASTSADVDEVQTHMLTTAALWYHRLSPEVRIDRIEYLTQGHGVARKEASAMGAYRDLAYKTFMDHIAMINRSANSEGLLPWSQVLPPLPASTPLGDNYNTNNVGSPGQTGQPMPLSNDAENFNFENDVSTPESMGSANVSNEWMPSQDEGTPGAAGVTSDDSSVGKPNPNVKESAFNDPDPHSDTPWDGSNGMAGLPPVSTGQTAESLAAASGPGNVGSGSMDESATPNLADYGDPNRSQVMGSAAFNYKRPTYAEYLARLSEGASKMSAEAYPGSLAAVSPKANEAAFTGGYTASYRYADFDDPEGKKIGENPLTAISPEDQHAQSGYAISSLPVAPEGHMADTFSNLTDFPNTGPTEVPSSRAPNVQENMSNPRGTDGNDGLPPGTAAYHWAADDDEDKDKDSGGSGFETPGLGGDFNPRDNTMKAQSPQGQADATEGYEKAYSGGAHMDWSGSGADVLGTPPVQGYEYNSDHPNGEMWAWQMGDVGQVPQGAAAVADTPTPGMISQQDTGSSYPQPNGVAPNSAPTAWPVPEKKNARLDAFRARIKY
jgi:hypothetical protein